MPLRFAFVMDPIERILPDKDTTFMFMLESGRRGHEVYYLQIDDLFIDRAVPYGRARRAAVRRPTQDDAAHHFLHEERVMRLDEFDAVFMRKDPPFDLAFFFATHALSLIDPRRTLVINEPSGLRDANEKLYALHFPDVIPDSLVTRDHDPPEGLHGRARRRDDRQAARRRRRRRRVPPAHRRPQRQRHPRSGDARRPPPDHGAALPAGDPPGRQAHHRPRRRAARRRAARAARGRDARQHPRRRRHREARRSRRATARSAPRLAPRLRADGLWFVGLDVIGDWLTEVNVTSPTGIQEINALDSVTLERPVIDFVEQRIAALRT